MKKYNDAIRAREWDILIGDEIHYVKNSKSIRAKELFGNRKEGIKEIQARRKIFLTGTPLLNRPIELWTLLHALDRKGIGANWKNYVERYCAAYQSGFGWDVSGASNVDELQRKLRSTIMIRRTKEDVLKELPPKTRQVIIFQNNDKTEKHVNAEITFYDKEIANIEKLQNEYEIAKMTDDDAKYKETIDKLSYEKGILFTEISKLRHKTSVAKIPLIIEHIKNILETESKIVVFAHHHDVMNALYNEFKDIAVKLTGEDNLESRQQSVDSFQENENIKIFIGSIKAAGVGITLTSANIVIFAELDWVPGNISQAEDRLHRIGQKKNVLVQHLILDKSIDAKLIQTIISKQEMIDKVLDSKIDFEFKNENIILIDNNSVLRNTTRESIEKEASLLTQKQIELIHAGIIQIANNCDDAISKDDIGFSKFDVNIGKQLAQCITLSGKQAVIGKKLVIKYHKQIDNVLYKQIIN